MDKATIKTAHPFVGMLMKKWKSGYQPAKKRSFSDSFKSDNYHLKALGIARNQLSKALEK